MYHLGYVLAAGLLFGCAADAAALEAATESDALTGSYDTYAALATRHGMPPKADRPLVIGIRGRDVKGRLHDTQVARVLDDTLVVLTPDKRAVVLAVSTHPWETEASDVPDVDRDGRGDVGMIRPGKYVAVRREASRNIAGAPTYRVTTAAGSDRLPGWRNTDHDDAYSAAERAASESRGDVLTAVLFHQAGAGAPPAIGCQVLDADGIRRLATETGSRFDYLLVDANDEEIPSP